MSLVEECFPSDLPPKDAKAESYGVCIVQNDGAAGEEVQLLLSPRTNQMSIARPIAVTMAKSTACSIGKT